MTAGTVVCRTGKRARLVPKITASFQYFLRKALAPSILSDQVLAGLDVWAWAAPSEALVLETNFQIKGRTTNALTPAAMR